MESHPAIRGDVKHTTTAKTYRNPQQRSKPNWRDRVKNVDFPPQNRTRSQGARVHPASGYVVNSTLNDGSGWLARVRDGGVGTEYRMKFNPRKSFHKDSIPTTTGRLIRKKLVYEDN